MLRKKLDFDGDCHSSRGLSWPNVEDLWIHRRSASLELTIVAY